MLHDDTTLTVVAERCLEEDVEKIPQWADRNNLKLKKTNLMLIGRKRREELN